jgi:phosphoglycolate phosphatase
MLLALKNLGLKMAVLSNKPHGFTRDFVEYFFPGQYFDIVFGQRPAVERKPSPQGAFEIASIVGVAPAQCLFIGDTAIDIETGRSAGMFTIGVLWGFRDRLELEMHHADLIVDQPEEITEYARRTR